MLRLGRVKSASDFKSVADAIRKKYPSVWKQYGTALSWPKVKAAKALGSKRRAATVAAKKRGSKRTSRKVAANAKKANTEKYAFVSKPWKHYLDRASKMYWAPGVTVEQGAKYLMDADLERALMRAAYPPKRGSR